MEPFDTTSTPLQQGITLIEASAGTGKTYSIAAIFLRLVLEEGLKIQEILAVTYTVSATQELRERIRNRLLKALTTLRAHDGLPEDPIVKNFLSSGRTREEGISNLELAVQSFDEARIHTIHSFCQRVLQEHAFESGSRYGCELQTDSQPLFEEVAHDFWRREFYTSSPLLAAMALHRKESPEDWVEILKTSRNHPNLRLLPEADPKASFALREKLHAALETVCCEWQKNGESISQRLLEDKALSRAKTAFSPDRTLPLLAALNRLASSPSDQLDRGEREVDSHSIEAVAAFCTTQIKKGTKGSKVPPAHPFFDLCEEFFAVAESYFLQLTHTFLAYADEELAARKLRLNVVNFDDLLTHLHRAVHGPSGDVLARSLGGKFRAALIDEFQDTDPLQYQIFQRLFAGSSHWLFFIGDPKQAIYGFRGADVFTYLEAAQSATHRYTLNTNYRSDELLLAGLNPFFLQRADAFVVKHIDYREVHSAKPEIPPSSEPQLEFRYLVAAPSNDNKRKPFSKENASQALAEAVAGDLQRLHSPAGGDWNWSDLAVLVRTHGQAALVQRALTDSGIRSVIHKEDSVFRSPEAAALQRILEAVLLPTDSGRLHAALATPLLAQNANAIAGLLEETQQTWLEQFITWRDVWRNGCFIHMFRRMLVEQDVRRRLIERRGGERRLTNILHLSELLHEAETLQRLTPESLCEWLARQRTNQRTPEKTAQIRLESDGEAVTIITVHKSKGLEYPVVLCPFLWSPADTPHRDRVQFHDELGRLTVDLRGKSGADPAHVQLHRQESLAEEVRALYVAVTRAKHRCIIYAGDISSAGESALGHLLNCEIGTLQEPIEALANSHPEAVSFSLISSANSDEFQVPNFEAAPPSSPSPSSQPVPELDSTLAARTFSGSLSHTAFLTSFSSLTAHGSVDAVAFSKVEVEAADPSERDRHLEIPAPASIREPAPPTKTAGPSGIFEFERGVRAGDFFHDVLENLDFEQPDDLEKIVPAKLALHGFNSTLHSRAIQEKLREVLEVELSPGLQLCQIGRKDRLPEVEFSCRLASLRPETLRAVFSDFESASLDPTELGRLRFSPVEGFLRGFIDLLFVHEGRYYVLDWKSNWLGDTPQDYDQAGIDASMRQHHYTLQAHLYVLAVDRFLAARLADYDYERDFGGVFYVFLRGVERENPERGIFRTKPPLELVKKLRTLTSDTSSSL